MAKKGKLETPTWIIEGYDSKADYEKAKGLSKTKKAKKKEGEFRVKICPNCKGSDVNVVIGEVGMWKCKKCEWKGSDIDEKSVSEDEYLELIEKMDGK